MIDAPHPPKETPTAIAPGSDAWARLLAQPGPILALAPMQDVTDWAFWNLVHEYGGADVYYTEFFRVTPDSRLDRDILRSITHNPTGRPVIAQLIGNDIPAMVRTARELQNHPVVAIDLNLGCPAPVVFKKCAGGGLLREPERVHAILGALREAIDIPFTVKTRIGFETAENFDKILAIFTQHPIDLLTVHGRTVADRYRPGVRYDLIRAAAQAMPCPVLANGDVTSPVGALDIWKDTATRGLMIGRGAVRNPWLFQQIRQAFAGKAPTLPQGRDVLRYIEALFDTVTDPNYTELERVHRVKKHLNFLGTGIDANGLFLHQMRRTTSRAELSRVAADFLDHDQPVPLEPISEAVPESATS